MWPLARPAAVFPLSPFSNSSRVHSSRGSSDYSVKASGMEAAGLDTEGRQFRSPDEMWVEYTGDDTKKHQWYREGVSYWEGVEASVDGVLGGYGHVNDADVKDSEAFIKNLFSELFVDGGRNRHLVALGTDYVYNFWIGLVFFRIVVVLWQSESVFMQIAAQGLGGSPKTFY
ncbi:Alpha N-terminal protein methyltransferase 1 [Linum perenne]